MKKKGSALIFSILMLSFFLALSLNVYFLARKKGEAAGVKVKGEKTTNDIDIASSIGYQEVNTAEKFLTLGILYDSSHPVITSTTNDFDNDQNTDDNIVTTGSRNYLNISNGTYDKKYAGIQSAYFIDYFTTHWDYENGNPSLQHLLLMQTPENRVWHISGVPRKAIPLWAYGNEADSKKVSIGGYQLANLIAVDDSSVYTNINFDSNPRNWILSNTTKDVERHFIATYNKIVHLGGELDGMNFKLVLKESFSIDRSANASTASDPDDFFSKINYFGRNIAGFSVTVLD